jgi:serine/threonine protein kinase
MALKVIHTSIAGENEKLRAALHREARYGDMLHHPNVVDTYDFGEEQGHAWIAMELIDGIRLDQLLGRYGRLAPDVALEVAAQICAGLELAGIVVLASVGGREQQVTLSFHPVLPSPRSRRLGLVLAARF